jgi:hypothetical protein
VHCVYMFFMFKDYLNVHLHTAAVIQARRPVCADSLVNSMPTRLEALLVSSIPVRSVRSVRMPSYISLKNKYIDR